MKRAIVFTIPLLLVAIIFAGTFRWWNVNIGSVSDDETPKYFVVPRGRSASQIGVKLFDQGLIKSSLAFKIYVQVFGKADKINAGEFKLSPNMSLVEIIETLQGGPIELWVTVPEGLRREEIVEIFIESLEKDEQESEVFREEFLFLSDDKKGFLFPDTYLFPPDVGASAVVSKMSQTFESKTKNFKKVIASSKYTQSQLITMASIIERETKTDEERPIVSGILWKRLETDGWLIQADATLQYAIANVKCQISNVKCEDWWPILIRDDLEIDSLYNSYKYKPLPPTPIANPGLSSIKAAIFPEDSDYWFYIHDSDGNIHYARTIENHNANVRKYLGK